MRALTALGDFEGLFAFATSKKSPIGYEPFVHYLAENGHAKEALSYVTKCDGSKRADLYMACGELQMAIKECKDRKDKGMLE